MLAPHAVDIHSWNLSNYYLTMFHICRTIRRHFCLRQVKLCIGLRKYKQKFTTQGSTDQASEFALAYLTPIFIPQNSRKKDVKNVINSPAYSFKSPPSERLCQWVIGGSINKTKHQTNQLVLTNFWWQHFLEFHTCDRLNCLINNGNWTKWNKIWSEIIRVISKWNEHAARVWFEITSMISDQNCITRSSIATLLHPFWNHTI